MGIPLDDDFLKPRIKGAAPSRLSKLRSGTSSTQNGTASGNNWKQKTIKSKATSSKRPPAKAEKALLLILSKDEREAILGDLAEEYMEIQVKFGASFAKVWYWKQVFTSAAPILRKAIKWLLIAWMGELIRRVIH